MNFVLEIAIFYHRYVFPKIERLRGATFLDKLLKEKALKSASKTTEDGVTSINKNGKSINFNNLNDIKPFLVEPHLTKEFIEEIDENTVVYDIGAYHGFYTFLGGTGEKSFGFEMDASNFEILKQNLGVNRDLNVEIINKAIWDSNTKIKAETDRQGRSNIKKGTSGDIDAIKIDSFVKHNKTPDVMKIDVEGAELQVLKGAKKTLKNSKPVIFVEIHEGQRINSFGFTKEELYNFLKELGYRKIFAVKRGKDIHAKFSS